MIGGNFKKYPKNAAAKDPIINWPSAPILKAPVLNAKETPILPMIKGTASTNVLAKNFGLEKVVSIIIL